MKILNLTQHKATTEQIAAGVYDFEQALNWPGNYLRSLLTFNGIPTSKTIDEKVFWLVELAKLHRNHAGGEFAVMIGGAPFLMGPLEVGLRAASIRVLYAFSERVSVDETTADGEVIKTAKFKHLGFYEVP